MTGLADHIGEYSDKIGDDTAVAPLYPGSSDGSREYDSEYPTGDYVTGGVSEPGEGMIVPPVGVGGQPTQSGTLTAGEWCDNENFDFFLNLLQKNSEFQLAKKYFGTTEKITLPKIAECSFWLPMIPFCGKALPTTRGLYISTSSLLGEMQ